MVIIICAKKINSIGIIKRQDIIDNDVSLKSLPENVFKKEGGICTTI